MTTTRQIVVRKEKEIKNYAELWHTSYRFMSTKMSRYLKKVILFIWVQHYFLSPSHSLTDREP